MSEFRELFLGLHNDMRDLSWKYGRLGIQDENGAWTIRIDGKPGWVHFRKGRDGKGGRAQAKNEGVPLHPDFPVKYLEENGINIIHGMDPGGGFVFTGGGIPLQNHAWMHDRLGPDPLYIRGLAFLPLAARPTSPPSMAVTVERAYYRYDSAPTLWTTANSSSLSAYIPASALVQHFVVISLDRTTGTLAITDGEDAASISSPPPFTDAQILTVLATIPASYWPIAAIRFYNGQTEIRSADISMDLRLWGGELFAQAGSVAASGWTVDYDAIILTGKDAFIPGRVLIESGASLTVDGDLYIV